MYVGLCLCGLEETGIDQSSVPWSSNVLTHKCFNNENPEIQKYTKNGNTNKDWNISMIKILSIYLEAKKIPPQV